MSLKKLACAALALLFVTATSLSSSRPLPSASLVGVWDFEVNVTRMVGRDGFVKKEAHFYEWVIRFRQDGTKLTGDLLGGRASRGETQVCADAAIEGSVRGGRIEFTITYQGACCKDEQHNFVGQVDEESNIITGSIEPADVPRGYSCRMEYADVKGKKRESRR